MIECDCIYCIQLYLILQKSNDTRAKKIIYIEYGKE